MASAKQRPTNTSIRGAGGAVQRTWVKAHDENNRDVYPYPEVPPHPRFIPIDQPLPSQPAKTIPGLEGTAPFEEGEGGGGHAPLPGLGWG